MKAAAQLIKEFQELETSDNEKEQWLILACEDYEKQMPNDRSGQCRLYHELGAFYMKKEQAQKAAAAYGRAKEILERAFLSRKVVSCMITDVKKDMTDSADYQITLELLDEALKKAELKEY